MENRFSLALLLPALLVGCAWNKKAPTPTPQGARVVVGTTRPKAPLETPVWIQPVFGTAWKEASTDPATGDFIGGHYVATIVEPGRWATQEEADTLGRSFLRPGENHPLPSPDAVRRKISGASHPSAVSLHNQMPETAAAGTGAPALPPAPAIDPSPVGTDVSPSASFLPGTREIEIRGQLPESGAFSIPTPDGDVVVEFLQHTVRVEYKGQAQEVDRPGEELFRTTLPPDA